MKNILLLTENQTHFLAENRQDPITQDSFSIGDEIVFCAECKSAFLKESWEFMNLEHCNQKKTLKKFPISERLLLEKPKLQVPSNYIKAEIEARIPAIFMDAVISLIVALFLLKIINSISNLDANYPIFYLGFALFIFRDSFFLNQSIGKRMMKLYFINDKTKKKAIWYRVFARNLIWWLFNGLIYAFFANTNPVFPILLLLITQIIYFFYVLIKGQSFIDECLQIELVEENEIQDEIM
ncbi:hypothetical protein Fleli_3136 [Bernardetia litoralis DSM 6794]|uniref:RDD domain-containing protein n=1 Tax=Bernardetia litoralis (strain ATCC 23117 / DSM 6794 / NBRC 15988 / NCIMB 1366 / Fx l1 / Sio-4) TaxID=880071 RepID=I4AND9_BERLS|nr:RDD family protein [Bernardetia litoralis]AFM05474.1 hypothetical protein Fleli_3136 [Bernardetia litoralis DSM 6794]